MKKTLLLVISALLITSITAICLNNLTIKTIKVLSPNYKDAIIRIEKTIILEDELDSYIGNISSIKLSNNLLLIFDIINKRALSVFDMSGKLQWQTKNGSRVEETYMPEGVVVDDTLIHIIDNNLIKNYDYNGCFSGGIELPPGFYLHNFESVSTNRCVAYGSFRQNNRSWISHLTKPNYFEYLIVTNNFEKQYNRHIRTSSQLMPLVCEHPISKWKNELLCVSKLTNYIYTVNPWRLKKSYYIDFGPFSIEKKDLKKGYKQILQGVVSTHKKGLLDNIYHNHEYLSFSYVNGREDVVHVISSKDGKCWCNWSELFAINNLPNMTPFGVCGESFIFAIKPSQLNQNDLQILTSNNNSLNEMNRSSNLIIVLLSVDIFDN